MKKTRLAVAAALFTVMGCANASVFTMSSTGTVKNGVDTMGLFGAAGRKLDGLPFTLTVTVELDGTARYTSDPNQYARVNASTPYIVALTIGEFDYAYRVTDRAQSVATVSDWYSMSRGPSGSLTDGVSLFNQGYDDFGRLNTTHLSFSIYGIRSQSLTQYLQIPVNDGNHPNTDFQVGNGAGSTYFRATGSQTFTVNGMPATLPAPAPDPVPVSDPPPVPNPSPVPEPASAMLIGAGLLGFATLRRQRSRR